MKRVLLMTVVMCMLLPTAGCGLLPAKARRYELAAARDAHMRGNDADAIERAGKVLASRSAGWLDADAYYIRGLARERSGDIAGAKADWLSCVGSSGSAEARANALLALGDMCYTAGDAQGAQRRYRQCIKLARADVPPGRQARIRLADLLQCSAPAVPSRANASAPGGDSKASSVWTVQAGAFSRRGNAESFTQRLSASNLEAVCRPERRGDKHVYVVTVGRYPSYSLAKAALGAVRGIENTAFVSAVR